MVQPSDYYLFLALKNALRGHQFKSVSEIAKFLDEFFARKARSFFERGIVKLANRRRMAIGQDGSYIVE